MIHRFLSAAALALLATAVRAADMPSTDINYSLRTGLSYTDNVFLAPAGAKVDSGTIFAGLKLEGARPSGRLRYNLLTDITVYDYLDVHVDQKVQGRASLGGSYDFVPESFTWNASLGYDQLRDDLLRPLGPGNIDAVVGFSTGPTLRLNLSGQMQFLLDGHYSQVDYSRRDYDSDTLGGRMTLMRQVTPSMSIGAGVSGDKISYQPDVAIGSSDYDRSEAFIKADLKAARTTLAIEAGHSRFSNAAAKSSGLMLRGQYDRKLTPTLSAFISAVREYGVSDAFTGQRRLPPGGLAASDDTPITVGARLTENANIGLDYHRPRTGARIVWSHNKEDGRLSGAGVRNYDDLRTTLTRQFTPRMRGAVDATLTREDFSDFASKATERLFGAQLDWKFGRALGLGVRVDHRSRDGVTAAGDYSEFRGNLYISYGSRLQ